MTLSHTTAALATALTLLAAPAFAEGDAEAGKKVFNKCKACHVVDKEQNRVGPHLVGIVDRDVASIEDFKYSKAMIEWGEGKAWTAENLDEYLEAPKKVVKGTKMAFAGLRKEEDRANLIAYLEAEAKAE